MKVRFLTIFLLITVFSMSFAGGKKDSANDGYVPEARDNVVVYAYDSFVADWGAGPEIVRLFEAKTGIKVTLISAGDAAEVLSRAILEKEAPKADVLIGIDNQLAEKAFEADILEGYLPTDGEYLLKDDLQLVGDWRLTPYDWSTFSFIFDTIAGIKTNVPEPASLFELTRPVYKKKIILMDPRTSTPGLGFVSWTLEVIGKGNPFSNAFTSFWTSLKPNILTMAPGWDAGYGLFTAGEAPLVISYTTSEAYHVFDGESDRYKALSFAEGHIAQVEYAGLVKNCGNKAGGQKFIDYLISTEAQQVLPATQWMYPANKYVELPSCYNNVEVPERILTVNSEDLDSAVNKVIDLLSK